MFPIIKFCAKNKFKINYDSNIKKILSDFLCRNRDFYFSLFIASKERPI